MGINLAASAAKLSWTVAFVGFSGTLIGTGGGLSSIGTLLSAITSIACGGRDSFISRKDHVYPEMLWPTKSRTWDNWALNAVTYLEVDNDNWLRKLDCGRILCVVWSQCKFEQKDWEACFNCWQKKVKKLYLELWSALDEFKLLRLFFHCRIQGQILHTFM